MIHPHTYRAQYIYIYVYICIGVYMYTCAFIYVKFKCSKLYTTINCLYWDSDDMHNSIVFL